MPVSKRQTFQRIAIVMVAMSTLIGILIWTQSPRTLRVAVGPNTTSHYAYLMAISVALRQGHLPFRFKLIPTKGTEESARLLDSGRADLAVLRSDDATSQEGRSLVIMQKRSLVLISPDATPVVDLAAAAGKTIAILNLEGDSNLPLVQRVLEHYGVKPGSITFKTMDYGALRKAMVDGTANAFILVSYPGTRRMRHLLEDLSATMKTKFRIVGMPGAEALAFRFKDLQTSTVPAGVFGGTPPLPPENVTTVAITYEIVATRRLPEFVGASLAKTLLDLRARLRGGRENYFLIETPGLEEARRYLPHPGTSAFVNDTAKTFLEAYSDEIWLSLFVLSLLGSSITGFFGWIGIRKRREPADFSLVLPSLIEKIENASTTADVDAAQKQYEAALKAMLLAHAEGRSFSESQKQAQLIIPVVRELIDSRRAALLRT